MARDIHELEVEFAKNPTPDACIPLCEAYLAQRRYMEAMVVCKKGIKNAPADVRGPVMLARIFLDQGKAPKAEQELALAAPKFPNNPFMLEMQGRLAVESGRRDEGIRFLQQALTIDPSLPNAKAMLTQLGAPLPSPTLPNPTPSSGVPALPLASMQAPQGAPPPRPAASGPPGAPPPRTAPQLGNPQQMASTQSQGGPGSQSGPPTAPRPMGASNTSSVSRA
ncbi:MAG: hypothetical protein H7Z43_01155, partial [Clostridia bacterium]|nr:hypothetical protein [Deltaproteobacteria bacterium]